VDCRTRSLTFGIHKCGHSELDKLYTRDWFGFGSYLPEAVMVTDAAARQTAAMCYIAWQIEGGKPTDAYIGKMPSVAREYPFPALRCVSC